MSSFSSETRLTRQRQITTLNVYNENVEELVENQEYRVKCNVTNIQLSLIVKLSPEFPDSAPVVVCHPVIQHHWVTRDGRVTGSPGLKNFTVHSDLGMVVATIRREFEKSSPSLQLTNASSSFNMDYSQQQQQSGDLIRNKLLEMEKDDLEDILNDEGALEKFLSNLSYPPLDNMIDNIASMEENIEAQAKNNIELQTEIETLRDSLLNKVQDYHEKKSELSQLHQRLTEMRRRVSGDVLADKLVRLSVKNEEESDKVADRFLSSDLSVEDFLQHYIKIRTDCHLQKLKGDKIKNSH